MMKLNSARLAWHDALYKRPDAAFIAVILGINTAEQGNRFARHLRVNLPARVQLLPFQLLALVLFPRLAQRGVDKGFELAPVLFDLEPFRDHFGPVGTDNAKELIYGRLKMQPDSSGAPVPGCIHLPANEMICGEDEMRQLTAERRKWVIVKHQRVQRWDAGGRRNEALDCLVYALAALRITQQRFGMNLDLLAQQLPSGTWAVPMSHEQKNKPATVAARISAALAMYIKKGTPEDYAVTSSLNGKSIDARSIPIGPGMVFDGLLPGEDVGMIESNRPNPFLEGFRNGQLKAVAAGTRGTYSSVARSYDGTYSAQRQELVEGQAGYDLLQHEFIDYWSRPVYREWLHMAIASGVIQVPVDVDPDSVFGAIYQGPVMPWINPIHEANAWKILVEAGFADESEVARARQRNPQELKRSRASEIKTNREQGLVFSSDFYHETYGKSQSNEQQNKTKPADDEAEGLDNPDE